VLRACSVWVFTLFACESPPTAPTVVPPPVATTAASAEHEDDCRRDIPDCSAACALRATHHLEFIDWYDRRCAAVVLGKNPDKAAGSEPPSWDDDAGRDADLAPNPYR